MQSWPSPSTAVLPSAPGRVRIHDRLTGGRREIGPETGTARLYVCGITPYDATHLGHANTYLAFDLLQRAWRDCGLDVHYVQNITDVDDPLLERANDTGVDWQQLAADQIELFRTDMTALRILPPRQYAGAVESIPLVLELIADLQRRGAVYTVEGEHADLYYRCCADPDFLAVSGLSAQEAVPVFAERGGDPDRAGKSDPLDCLVWLQQRPGEPGWESPLGAGRPGWHIECTAIARRWLGENFDVQGGGSDLIFPHHEMCASQARTAGAELAQAYVHAGMVGLDGEKMSKSRGNLVLVSKLRAAGRDPMAIRLALLSHHYRTDWFWTDDLLTRAEARLERWRAAAALPSAPDAGPVVDTMRRAVRDDLDAPVAARAVDDWAETALTVGGHDDGAPDTIAAAADALLGVTLR